MQANELIQRQQTTHNAATTVAVGAVDEADRRSSVRSAQCATALQVWPGSLSTEGVWFLVRSTAQEDCFGRIEVVGIRLVVIPPWDRPGVVG